jgi:aspartate kinase
MFTALAAAQVNIQMISTSEVQVSCAIDLEDCDRAIAALCQTFDISSSPIQGQKATNQRVPPMLPPVRGAALDLKQARLAIRHVPDRPGMAAKIFQLLAQHSISVDMIIQSQRCRLVNQVPTRDIAFTVAQMDAAQTQRVLQDSLELGCGEVTVDEAIAKVSIVGIGMVGRPGVAAKMFEALARAKINIQMIATSEIKISCVVAEPDGIRALQVIHAAFQLAGNERVQVVA